MWVNEVTCLPSCFPRPPLCALVSVAVVGGLAACTEPRFPSPPDAGTRGELPDVASEPQDGALRSDAMPSLLSEPSDAGREPPDAAPPPMATELPGRYARRSTYFASNGAGGSQVLNRGYELALVDIAEDGHGGLTWTTQLCEFTIEDAIHTEVRITTPDALPPIRQPVTWNHDGTFFVPLASVGMGYEPQRFAAQGCDQPSGSGRGQRYPDQLWRVSASQYADGALWNDQGTCACAASETDLPALPTDCRLIDSDHDDAPGLTVDAQALIGPAYKWSLVLGYGLSSEGGTRAPDGSLQVVERHVLRPSCVDRATQLCTSGPSLPCRPETGETLIVPLAGQSGVVSCGDLRAAATQLFPSPLRGFPSQDCIDGP